MLARSRFIVIAVTLLVRLPALFTPNDAFPARFTGGKNSSSPLPLYTCLSALASHLPPPLTLYRLSITRLLLENGTILILLPTLPTLRLAQFPTRPIVASAATTALARPPAAVAPLPLPRTPDCAAFCSNMTHVVEKSSTTHFPKQTSPLGPIHALTLVFSFYLQWKL